MDVKKFILLCLLILQTSIIFSNPLVEVIIINACDWNVSVGLGENLEILWTEEKANLTLQLQTIDKNNTVKIDNVVSNNNKYIVIVDEITTKNTMYNISKYKFMFNTKIIIYYENNKYKLKLERIK